MSRVADNYQLSGRRQYHVVRETEICFIQSPQQEECTHHTLAGSYNKFRLFKAPSGIGPVFACWYSYNDQSVHTGCAAF
jgi:hypothetical protein